MMPLSRRHLVAAAGKFLVAWQEQVCCMEVASANCDSPAHEWFADVESLVATSSAPRVVQWWQQQDADLEAVPLEGVVELTGDTTLP